MEQLNEIPYFNCEIMFYSRSAHAKVGCGCDEILHPSEWEKYNTLNTISHWRRTLSNFYSRSDMQPLFELDDRKWFSVEHYFHAQKFKDSHPEFYEQFAMGSKSILSTAEGPAVKKAGRTYKMSEERRAQWDGGESAEVLRRANEAKYRQNPDCKKILLLTNNAILKHRPSRFGKLVIEHDLMTLRDKLAAEN